MLKVAILAEKYAVDYTWYVDTILNLIRIAGDYVSEEVWYRVIQIVINRDDVQGYAAKTVFEVRMTVFTLPRWKDPLLLYGSANYTQYYLINNSILISHSHDMLMAIKWQCLKKKNDFSHALLKLCVLNQ